METDIVTKILHDVQPLFLRDFDVNPFAVTNLKTGANHCLESCEASDLLKIKTNGKRVFRLFEILRGKPTAIDKLITYIDECQPSQSHLKEEIIKSRNQHLLALQSISPNSTHFMVATCDTSTSIPTLTRFIGEDNIDEIFDIAINDPVAYEHWQCIVEKLVKSKRNLSLLNKLAEEGVNKETIVLKTLKLFCKEQSKPCSVEKFLNTLSTDVRFASLDGEIKKILCIGDNQINEIRDIIVKNTDVYNHWQSIVMKLVTIKKSRKQLDKMLERSANKDVVVNKTLKLFRKEQPDGLCTIESFLSILNADERFTAIVDEIKKQLLYIGDNQFNEICQIFINDQVAYEHWKCIVIKMVKDRESRSKLNKMLDDRANKDDIIRATLQHFCKEQSELCSVDTFLNILNKEKKIYSLVDEIQRMFKLVGDNHINMIREIIVRDPTAYDHWQSIVIKMIKKDKEGRSDLDKMLEDKINKDVVVHKTLQLFLKEKSEPCLVEKFVDFLKPDKKFAALIDEIRKKELIYFRDNEIIEIRNLIVNDPVVYEHWQKNFMKVVKIKKNKSQLEKLLEDGVNEEIIVHKALRLFWEENSKQCSVADFLHIFETDTRFAALVDEIKKRLLFIGDDQIDEIFQIIVRNHAANKHWNKIIIKLIKGKDNKSKLDKMLLDRVNKETFVLKSIKLFCREQSELCPVERFLSILNTDVKFAVLIGEIKKRLWNQ